LKFDASGKRIGDTVNRLPAFPTHLTESQREAIELTEKFEANLVSSRKRINELTSAINQAQFELAETARLEGGEDSFDDFYAQKVFDGARDRLNEATALYQLHNQLRLEMVTGLDRELEQIEQNRLERIFTIQGMETLGEQQKADAIKRINAAADKAIVDSKNKAANEQNAINDRMAASFGAATGQMVGALYDLSNSTEDVWNKMASAFGDLFLAVVLNSIAPGSSFATAFINSFKFWDIYANDQALIREGQRAAMFIRQGVDEGLSNFVPNLVPFRPNPNYGSERQPSHITINFNGPVSDQSYVRRTIIPEIERAIIKKQARIEGRAQTLTGKTDVRTR
jgi:hypothetical protein